MRTSAVLDCCNAEAASALSVLSVDENRAQPVSSWRLCPRALLRLPDVAELTAQTALPNEVHPSDHVPLAVRLEFQLAP